MQCSQQKDCTVDKNRQFFTCCSSDKRRQFLPCFSIHKTDHFHHVAELINRQFLPYCSIDKPKFLPCCSIHKTNNYCLAAALTKQTIFSLVVAFVKQTILATHYSHSCVQYCSGTIAKPNQNSGNIKPYQR